MPGNELGFSGSNQAGEALAMLQGEVPSREALQAMFVMKLFGTKLPSRRF